jgi:hypothetical protein
MTSSEISNLWCYNRPNGSVFLACVPATLRSVRSADDHGIANRSHREVTMESWESVFTGPMLYLAVAWAVITVVFMALMIWRTLLTSHEDDQIFLSKGEDYMAREQRELIAKITRLARPILTTGIASGGLLLLIVGMYVYQGLKHF